MKSDSAGARSNGGVGDPRCAHTGFADGCIPYPYISPQLFLTIHPIDLSCTSVCSECFFTASVDFPAVCLTICKSMG